MSILELREYRQFLAASTDRELHMDAKGNVSLLPDNLWPNQYGVETGPDGTPAEWDLSGMPEEIVAYHYNVTRPASGGRPARRSTLARQTTDGVPLAEGSWTKQGPWFPGVQGSVTARSRKPAAPEVEAAPEGARGFAAGRWGWAWGTKGKWGRTTITGVRFYDLLNNEVPKLPVPDSFAAGSEEWCLYKTKKNGDETTLRLQRSVPIGELDPGGEYVLHGPWRNRGRPPNNNRSGIEVGRSRRNRDYRVKGSDAHCLPGKWRPAPVVVNDRGVSLAAPLGRAIHVKPDTVLKKVKGPAPENVGAEAGASSATAPDLARAEADTKAQMRASGARPDPRSVRPPGKLPGNEGSYAGEELDFSESALLDKINAHRAANGLPYLVVSQVMNRAANRRATGDRRGVRELARREGYGGDVIAEERVEGRGPGAAFPGLRQALRRGWTSVGVARDGDRWAVVLGEPILDPTGAYDDFPEGLVCEHVDESGEAQPLPMGADAPEIAGLLPPMRADLGWDNVEGRNLRYDGANQYRSYVDNAAARLDRVSALNVERASAGQGVQVAISVGSLGGGVYARTYSNGRMIINGYYFERGSRNANESCMLHEFGHCGRCAHVRVRSMMNTPIRLNSFDNVDQPTGYDVGELRRFWGSNEAGGGSPGGDGNGREINIFQATGGNGADGNRDGGNGPDGGDEPDGPEFHWERVPDRYKRNACLFHETPKMVLKNPDLKWTVYWQHEAEDGTVTWYRAYPKRGRRGTASFFEAKGEFRRGIEVNGYVPEEEPAGLAVGLVQEDPPQENTTVIEAPDPTGVPDAPERGGVETMPPGPYLATVQGVLAGGGLTAHSEPGQILNAAGEPRNLAAGELLKVTPASSVNQLKNAEVAKLDAQGKPEDWTFANTSSSTPGYYDATDETGVLLLGAVSATSNNPRGEGRPIRVDAETVLTVGCQMSAETVAGSFVGTARYALRQYDENMAFISELAVGELSGPGEVTVERRFGAGGAARPGTTPLDPGCAYVAVCPRLAGATSLCRARFWDMYALPFPCSIRKVGPDPESPFEANPDTPFPNASYARVGAPLDPLGTVGEPEPPREVVGFEDGAVPASWGAPILNGAPDLAVEAANPLFESRSLRIRDASGTARRYGHHRKTYASMTGRLFAFRGLYGVDQRPTAGYFAFHPVFRDNGDPLGVCRLYATGRLTLVVRHGNQEREYFLASVPNGARLDVEIGYASGRNGTLRASVGLGREARRTVFSRSYDFDGVLVRTGGMGVVYMSDARGRYDLRMDQFVVTEAGDVLDREKPGPPAGHAPVPPDRPTRGGGPRRFEADDEPIKQAVFFLKPGDAPATAPARVPLLEDPQPVRPGATYGVGAFARFCVFTPEAAPGIRVWLEGEEGEDVEPRLALSLLPMSGERGWHPGGGPGEAAEEDDYGTFDVPAEGGYTRARFEAVLHDGFYVIQEPLLHPDAGGATAFAERDAKRGYGRALSASGEFVFDSMPEAYDLGMQVPVFYSDVGVKTSPPGEPGEDAGMVEASFARSRDRLAYAPYERAEDEPYRYLKTRVSLSRTPPADGGSAANAGPRIPAGGLYLRTWQPAYACLLRRDGTHFPGVAQAGADLVYHEYPDVEAARVGGHHQSVPQGDGIGRLYGVKINAYTEAAMQEIEALSLLEELIIEVTGAGGSVAGRAYRIRMRSLARFAVRDFAPSVRPGPSPGDPAHRWILATAEVEEAEVLRVHDLPAPMEPADFSAGPARPLVELSS